MSKRIRKACAILKNSENDTEKFASLYVVINMLKDYQIDAEETEEITMLFEAFDHSFLRRICKDHSHDDHSEMLALVTALLKFFTSFSSLTSDSELEDLLNLTLFSYKCYIENNFDKLSADAYKDVVIVISQFVLFRKDVGFEFLRQANVESILFPLLNFTPHSLCNETQTIEEMANRILFLYFGYFDDELILSFFKNIVIPSLQQLNASSVYIISINAARVVLNNSTGLQLLRKLNDFFTQSLTLKHKQSALSCFSSLLNLSTITELIKSGQIKHIQLFTNIACVELRMLLDEKRTVSYSSLEEYFIKSTIKGVEQILICFVENEVDALECCYEGFAGILNSCLQYIIHSDVENCTVIECCIRLLGLWLKHDTLLVAEKLNEFYPKLIFILKHFYMNNSNDYIQYLLPAIYELATDESNCDFICKHSVSLLGYYYETKLQNKDLELSKIALTLLECLCISNPKHFLKYFSLEQAEKAFSNAPNDDFTILLSSIVFNEMQYASTKHFIDLFHRFVNTINRLKPASIDIVLDVLNICKLLIVDLTNEERAFAKRDVLKIKAQDISVQNAVSDIIKIIDVSVVQ